MDEDIKVAFIIPRIFGTEKECSEEMQLAFTACDQHRGGGLKAEWIKETNWKLFTGLTKKDVFVLQDFQGEFYDKLRTTKCLIVGPRCLSCCLTEGVPIPSGPEPVYTIAMRGIVTTASGLTKAKKEHIRRRIQQMGGTYSTVLTDETTHLISDTVLSDKYIKAVEKGLAVMSESWVEAVWEASLNLNVNGASSDFNCHKLPTFANLQVTTSGISKRDKQMIMKLVNENGGNFSGAFQSESTDIVVLTKEGVGSEKYKAALEYGKACVLPTWVKDSAAMGVALPLARYRVAGASTSSPLAEHRLPDMSLNFSRITNVKAPNNFVDETRSADASTMSGRMKLSQENISSKNDTSMDKETLEVFENFDMSSIKKAGPIFDGFCIWVSGLEGVYRERALACVSRCGGVRYDGPHRRVTHAVAGTPAAAAAAAAAGAPVLRPAWLLRSVRAGAALPEAQFLVDVKPATPAKSSARKQRVEPASPLSKRSLQMLRRGPLNLPPPTPEVDEPAQDEIVNHYLSQPMPEPEPEPQKSKSPEQAAPNVSIRQPDATEATQEPTEVLEQIFLGVKIEVQGLEEEAVCEVGAELAAAGGVLCAAGAGGQYVLLPLDCDPAERRSAAARPVTVLWLKDCLSQQELLPIQYYHQPVNLPQWTGPAPLEGVVASLSTYSGIERAFLDELAKLLGATTQLRFCRRNTANALASTHLICPAPSGDKYQGALKWGLPAVTAGWLLACAQEGRRVPERGYLVGDTRAPPSPVKPVPEKPPANENVDKENIVLPSATTSVTKRNSIPSREEMLKNFNSEDVSPASRYIAMSRQGLLASQETKSPQVSHDDGNQGTPSSTKAASKEPPDGAAINKENEMLPPAATAVPKRGSIGSRDELARNKNFDGASVRTPPLEDALSTPNLLGLSPTIRKHLQAFKRGDIPSNAIRTPNNPFENTIETPDSAFGAALKPGSGKLSPEKRKHLWKFVNGLPTKQEIEAVDKIQTPLSEIRNRFLAQYKVDTPTQPAEHQLAPRKLNLQDQAETPPAKMAKLSADQSAGGASIGSAAAENNTSVNAEKDSSYNEDSSASSASSTLPPAVADQLQRLSAALSGRTPLRRRVRPSGSTPAASPHEPAPETEPGPESQPNTVGWDDTTPAQEVALAVPAPQKKRFMLSSNVDNCEEIAEMISWLGGEVCEGPEPDAAATHLLCAAPTRSEKILGSVAAGRWVLHPAYAARSRASGAFLPEEDFEWGNPRAECLPALSNGERQLANAAYRWRSARAGGRPGPFAGVTALLHVPPARRRLLARLVTAGDGLAPELEPPYDNADVNVCFADVKRYPLSERDAAWLVSKRIPVCAPVLLSAYLTEDTPPKPQEHCLPEYRPK